MTENEAIHLLPEFAVGSAGLEAAFGAAYFGVAIVAAFLVYFIVSKVVRRATGKTSTTLDDLIVSAIGRPVFLFVVVFGPYIGLTATTFLDAHQEVIDRGLLSALIFVVGYLLKRLVDAVIIWYGKEIAGENGRDVGRPSASLSPTGVQRGHLWPGGDAGPAVARTER